VTLSEIEPYITAGALRRHLGRYFGRQEMSWVSFRRALAEGLPAHAHPCGGRRQVYYLSEVLAWLGARREETRLAEKTPTRISSPRKPRKRATASEAR
jgi:hypothetical protein